MRRSWPWSEIWPDSRHVFYKQFDERLGERFSVGQRQLVRRLLRAVASAERGLSFDAIEALVAEPAIENPLDAETLVALLTGLDFLSLEYSMIAEADSDGEQPKARYRLALETIRGWLSARGA